MCDAAWYKEFLELNPRERKRRDLVVDHAEAEDEVVTEYFRRLLPRYWFDPDAIPPGTVGSSLGLAPEDEDRLIVQMSKIVLPAFQATAEYKLAHDSSALRFPQTQPAEPTSGRSDSVDGGFGSGGGFQDTTR